MNEKALHEHIINLLDYAERLIGLIEEDENDRDNYFITLVYIEDIIDTYGRSMVHRSIIDSDIDDDGSTKDQVNKRLDELRSNIKSLVEKYDFNDALQSHTHKLMDTWSKPRH